MSKSLSISGKIWNILSEDIPNNQSNLFNILIKNRAINEETINNFLKPSLTNLLPDPFSFIDMDKAVERILKAIIEKQEIAILGDYDVDGVSSTSLLINFLKHLKIKYSYHIPNRIDHGYGVSINLFEKYKDHLIITVDCGSSSLEELKYAKQNNIEVIVIDHHKMQIIPEGFPIINPHRPDEKNEQYKILCAAAMVFLTIVGINQKLREINYYNKEIQEPILKNYLDLVALATVCDVMPLVGINRAFVLAGIQAMKRRANLGIDALISVGKIKNITSNIIGFHMGPRLNSAGRIDSADISVKLLTTENPIEARNLALKLEQLNKKRQQMEADYIDNIEDSIDKNLNFICIYSEQWHPGLIGIIAGRLKEKYQKPVIVITIDSDGMGRASCRSIQQIDISQIISKGIKNNIIKSGGGHTLAAGFSINQDKINELIEFLKSEINIPSKPAEIHADCVIPLDFISTSLVEHISKLEPFGSGNKHPKFVIKNTQVKYNKIIGEKHLSITLVNENEKQLKAMAFRSVNSDLGNLLQQKNIFIDLIGEIHISEWNGNKTANFFINDAMSNLNNGN